MKPGKRILDIMGFSPPGNGGPVDHDDRQAKRAGRVNLGPRPGSPGVFRNDDLNAMRPHQRKITLKVKRAARDDRLRLWQRERPWRINQAQEVIMLRLAGESGEIHAPDCEEHTLRRTFQSRRRRINIRHSNPAIPLPRHPWRAGQGQQRDTCPLTGGNGIGAHLSGERMCSVNHMADGVILQPGCQAFNPAKSANTHWQGLRSRVFHPPREADGRLHPARGKDAAQLHRLTRAPQQQEVHLHG